MSGPFTPGATYVVVFTHASGEVIRFEATADAEGNLNIDLSPGTSFVSPGSYNFTVYPLGDDPWRGTPDAQVTISKFLFIHSGLSGPIMATDYEREVVWRKTYYPFGSELDTENESFTKGGNAINLGFVSRQADEDVGLYQLGARWYDPDIGRFISVDPVFNGFNQYSYAANNPYRYHDRSGLQFEGLMLDEHALAFTQYANKNPRQAMIINAGAAALVLESPVLVQDKIEDWTDCNAACQDGILLLGPWAAVGESFQIFRSYIAVQNELKAASALAGGGVRGYKYAEKFSNIYKTRVTEKGLARIERHLKRPDIRSGKKELGMLKRLKEGKRTIYDLRFYQHELKETRMINKVIRSMGDVRQAHDRTLYWYGIDPWDDADMLIHPSLKYIEPDVFIP